MAGFSQTSLSMEVGDEVTLTYTGAASQTSHDFSSTDTSVATVTWARKDGFGSYVYITAVGEGSCTIEEDSGDTVSVTVGGGSSGGDSGDDESFTGSFSKSSITIEEGSSTTVTYTMNTMTFPSGFGLSVSPSSVASASYSQSAYNKATITVKGKSAGSATLSISNGDSISITVTAADSGGDSGGSGSGGGDSGDDDGDDVVANTVSISGPTSHYKSQTAEFTASTSGSGTLTWGVQYDSSKVGLRASETAVGGYMITPDLDMEDGPWSYTVTAKYGVSGNMGSDTHSVSIVYPQPESIYIDGPLEVAVGTSLQYYYAKGVFNDGGDAYDLDWTWTFTGVDHLWVPGPYSNYGYMEFTTPGEIEVTLTGGGLTITETIVVMNIEPEDLILEGVSEKEGYDGAVKIPVGSKYTYEARIIPEASRYQPEIISQDTSVAINRTGDIAEGNPVLMSVTGVSAGTDEVVIGCGDVRKTLFVEVDSVPIPVTQFLVSPYNIVTKVGRKATARYTYLPADANTGTTYTSYGIYDNYSIRIHPTGLIEVTGRKEMTEPVKISRTTDTGAVLEFTVMVESSASKLNITYDGNGGIVSRDSDSTAPGTSCLLPDAVKRVRDVATEFMGWYTTAEGEGTFVGTKGNVYAPVKSTTLYARWAPAQPEPTGAMLSIANDQGEISHFHLGTVKGIEDSYAPALTKIPTIIYGAENRFVTDTGVQRKFNVQIDRVNPIPYNDESPDDWKWSNGKWWNEFRNAVDFWQNLACDPFNFERTGGFVFSFKPDDEELYPPVNENVFLSGSVTPSFSVQKMSFTLPLVVARMNSKGSTVETVTVTLFPNLPSVGEYQTKSYPKGGQFTLPSCPSAWTAASGLTFVGWSESENGSIIPMGKQITMDADKTYYAQWTALKALVILSGSDRRVLGTGVSYTETNILGRVYEITSSAITRMTVLVVGGGGSAGNGQSDIYDEEQGVATYFAGGGGGSGQVKTHSYSVSYGTRIIAFAGRGGYGKASNDDTARDGENGNASYVTIGPLTLRAEGGEGGKAARPGALSSDDRFYGGQLYNAGGAADTSTGNGEDGKTSAPNLEENVGKGGKKYSGVLGTGAFSRLGGGGGGAAALNHKFVLGPLDSPTTYEFVSKGGNGKNNGTGGSGTYGGGGGSSPNGKSGEGGMGLVVLAFH